MQPYTHLTLQDRSTIHKMKEDGATMREIARKLQRAPSTIKRELDRSVSKDGSYHYWRATALHIHRRKKSVKRYRIAIDIALRDMIVECLEKGWPPEAIVGRYKRENPGSKLSPTTIYKAIRCGLLPGCSRKSHLRRRGKRRVKAKTSTATIKPDRLIKDWPEPIVQRSEIGHWEGDTVFGAIGKGLVFTAVDRKSRFLAVGLMQSREKEHSKEVIIKTMRPLTVGSLSFDRGSEFSAFREIEYELKALIYFADAHSPWQRGSNENMNGVLRFYFPKGCDFRSVTKEYLDYVVALINDRPRKCLGWLTPREVYRQCCT